MAAKNSQKPFLYFVNAVLEGNTAIGLWRCRPFPPTTDTKYITISQFCQYYGTLLEGKTQLFTQVDKKTQRLKRWVRYSFIK